MDRSVGKALEFALKEKDTVNGNLRLKSKDIFANHHRRDIFTSLTLFPCMTVAEISHRTLIKTNTVGWHIERLVNSGYIIERHIGKRRVFYPEGLIPMEDVSLFHTLNQSSVRTLVPLLYGNPGSSQRELAEITGMSHQSISKVMKVMVSESLISTVSDGTRIRYYPTNLLSEKSDGFYDSSKRFTSFMFRILREERGEEPRIIKKNIDRIMLELGTKKGKYRMEIGINPYMTFL
jgi:predicted transcriptional regulator